MIINFEPFPILETDRLVLRRIDDNDAPQIFKLRSDPEVMKFVPRPLATTIGDAKEHIANINAKIAKNDGINWAITLKGTIDFIGIIGHFCIKKEHFRSEVGYMLLPEFHGNGIMSEALAVVMTYGFNELKLHSVEAIIGPENYASAKVLENNGFIKEAHFIENEYFEGKFLDTVVYSKLASK